MVLNVPDPELSCSDVAVACLVWNVWRVCMLRMVCEMTTDMKDYELNLVYGTGDQSKPGLRSALSCTVQPAAPTSVHANGQPPAALTSAQPEPSDIHSRLPAKSAVSACKPAHARPTPDAEVMSAAAAAAATLASSKASSQDKRQQTAKAYLSKLQEALPAAAYQQVMKCLQQYRKDHDTLKVTDGVMDLLRAPSRRHLLLDFATFLRSQDRDWFLRCVK